MNTLKIYDNQDLLLEIENPPAIPKPGDLINIQPSSPHQHMSTIHYVINDTPVEWDFILKDNAVEHYSACVFVKKLHKVRYARKDQ